VVHVLLEFLGWQNVMTPFRILRLEVKEAQAAAVLHYIEMLTAKQVEQAHAA
jgi:hypothetical protein